MTPEEQEEFIRRRKARNGVIALGLFGLVVLFYFITIARIGGN
tara:strand:- start:113414 stop:113542 length:129 start_codon:yes stop_codon:yes gene_type:complete